MREIKFRGYYTGDTHFPAGWVYGSLIREAEGKCSIMEFDGRMCWSVEPDSVSQYIGKEDINGAEIYFGDLIAPKQYPFYGIAPGLDDYEGECKELNYIGQVYWDDDDLLCVVGLCVVSDRVSGRACGGAMYDYENIEVIGNIRENPELVEGNES